MIRSALPALLLLTLAAPGSAVVSAPRAAHNSDVRCLMLSNLFAKAATDPRGKEAASQTRIFYLGRVAGRMPPAAIEAAMATEGKTIVPAQAGKEMTACLATVQSAAAEIEAIGNKVQQTVAPNAPAAQPAAPPKP